MKNLTAIIDFGSSKVITLVGSMGINDTLTVSGKGEVSYAGFQNSTFIEPENLKNVISSSIANAEDSCQEKIDEVYIGVPGEFSAVTTQKISLTFSKTKKITQEDIEKIIKTENSLKKDIVYCAINSSVIYYEIDGGEKRFCNPINLKAKKITALLSHCLALRTFIDDIKTIFDEMNVKIKGFIPVTLAESLYLFDLEMRDKYTLFVDAGYITTTVAVAYGDGLLFSSSFSMGGGNIASDLAQCLRIPFVEAERLKNKVAIAWQPSEKDTYSVDEFEKTMYYAAKATNEIVMDRVDLICEYIKKCLELCNFVIPEFLPMYLAGGGLSSIGGIRNVMAHKLDRQVLDAVPSGLIEISPYTISEDSVLRLAINHSKMLDYSLI